MSGFKLSTVTLGPYGRGFAIRFANDYVVSVQFGPKNNCSVKNNSEDDVVSLDNIDDIVKGRIREKVKSFVEYYEIQTG